MKQEFECLLEELHKYNNAEKSLKQYYEANGTFSQSVVLDLEMSDFGVIPTASHQIKSLQLLSPSELTEDIYLTAASDVFIVKHPRYTPPIVHHHTFFEIVYVLDGVCSNVVDTQEMSMKTGDICIIPPKVEHSITVNTDSLVMNILIRTSTFSKTFMMLLNKPSILSEFFTEILYSNKYKKYLLFHTSQGNILDSILLEMYKEQKESCKYHEDIMNGMLLVFLGKLLQQYEDAVEYPEYYYEKYNYVPKIINYIQQQCITTSLTDCAEHFHFNPQYLGTLLKNHTGKTFSEILTEAKMKKAVELLQNKDIKIQDLGQILDYTDSSYFMKVFKKHFGCTPSDYRRLNIPKPRGR